MVAGLTWGCPRLMHCVFTHMVKGPEELRFHRDDDGVKVTHGFRNPNNDFQVADGEIYCSHLATWVALADVPPGNGILPGAGQPQVHRAGTGKACPSDTTRPCPSPSQ